MKSKLDDIDNEQLAALIDLHIRGERNRAILKRRLIDLVIYEDLAEEFDRSERQIRNIVYKLKDQLFRKI